MKDLARVAAKVDTGFASQPAQDKDIEPANRFIRFATGSRARSGYSESGTRARILICRAFLSENRFALFGTRSREHLLLGRARLGLGRGAAASRGALRAAA
jgi:hypothetical protein